MVTVASDALGAMPVIPWPPQIFPIHISHTHLPTLLCLKVFSGHGSVLASSLGRLEMQETPSDNNGGC